MFAHLTVATSLVDLDHVRLSIESESRSNEIERVRSLGLLRDGLDPANLPRLFHLPHLSKQTANEML